MNDEIPTRVENVTCSDVKNWRWSSFMELTHSCNDAQVSETIVSPFESPAQRSVFSTFGLISPSLIALSCNICKYLSPKEDGKEGGYLLCVHVGLVRTWVQASESHEKAERCDNRPLSLRSTTASVGLVTYLNSRKFGNILSEITLVFSTRLNLSHSSTFTLIVDVSSKLKSFIVILFALVKGCLFVS